MAKQRIIPIIYKVDYSQVDKSTASVKKAEQATDKLNKEIKETETVGKKSFGALESAIVASGIIGVVGSLARKVLEIGIAAEQTSIAFNTFLGSAAKGKALLQDLTKFAIVTPFTPEQVNKAAKSLLAFGVEGKKIIPTLKILGDVSSGTGKDLAEMAIIFGQIRSTGRLMGQDLLQLINAGFNPLQIISEKTGKSVAVLKQEMEKGLITFDMVEGAFKDATAAGGLFFNLMEKQSKSLGGILSTIEGNLEEIAKGLFEKQAGALKETADSVAELTSNTEIFVDLIDGTFNAVLEQTHLPLIKDLIDVLREWRDETERLRKEELQLQLVLAKGDLDNAFSSEMRVKAIQKIIELSRQLGQLPTGTTEDPLPWATEEKAKAIEKVIKANEKARAAFLKMMGFTTAAEKVNAAEKEAEELEKILSDANDRSLKTQEYFDKLKRKKAQEQRDYEYEQLEAAANEQIELEKRKAEEKREIQESAFEFGIDLIGGLLLANNDRFDQEEQALRDKYDNEILLAGDNERRKGEIELRRADEEKKLRAKQLEDEKRQNTRRILIETVLNAVKALGLPPIPGANYIAAAKATAYGLLAAGLSRRYSKGSEVGIDGPGSTTSDSIPAMLSKGETVMSYSQTEASKGILKAIKAKRLDDRVIEKLYKGAKTGGDGVAFNDERIVQELRKNKPADYRKVGSYLFELKSQNSGHVKHVRSKYIH